MPTKSIIALPLAVGAVLILSPQPSLALQKRFGAADGDACTVRTLPDGTKVPGKVEGLECCSNTDANDCVVILKPFPGLSGSPTIKRN